MNAHPDHDNDGEQSLNSDEFDSVPDDGVVTYRGVGGANIQEYLTCETLPNFGAPDDFQNDNPDYNPEALIDLEDVKPGDCGEVTFSYHICDNPGYIWLLGELGAVDETLAETIRAKVWYDLDCDNVFDPEQERLIFEWGRLTDLLAFLEGGVLLDPSVYDNGDIGGDGSDENGADGECAKVGKVDIGEDGGFGEVDGASAVNNNEFLFNETSNAPPWSGDGDYLARDATVKIEITGFKDDDGTEPVAFRAEVTGSYGLCRIRVNGGTDTETFYDLGEGDEECVIQTREIETALENPGGQRTAISNIEFFVCDLDGDDPPDPPGLCFPADETFCVGFEWCIPADAEIEGSDDINDLQGESVQFDLGFYTEQCRHNDDPTGPTGL